MLKLLLNCGAQHKDDVGSLMLGNERFQDLLNAVDQHPPASSRVELRIAAYRHRVLPIAD
jgi:hypothetical protein